jgi:hypothetical protein
MSTLGLKFKPIKKNNILFKPLDDGAILFDPAAETVHTLNPSAAFIWLHCDGENSIEDIVYQIKQNFTEFQQSPAEAVFNTINTFQSLNLLSE